MKTVIVNDTSAGGHFGCVLTMQTYREQLERVGVELLGTIPIGDDWKTSRNRDLLDKADLVIVNGEGSLHHNRRRELVYIASQYHSILINAVYQGNKPDKRLQRFQIITVRESMSKAELSKEGVDSAVVPDIVFSSQVLRDYEIEGNERGVGIVDSVLPQEGSTIIAGQGVDAFLKAISRHQLIVTGRFHGIVACAVLGIPFIAYPSNTHKNISMMRDMGVGYMNVDTIKEALYLISLNKFWVEPGWHNLLDIGIVEYVASAREKIDSLFEWVGNDN